MFTGIVETTSQVLSTHFSPQGDVLRIRVSRPAQFDDLKLGDSISTNGVCLTIEKLDSEFMEFALGLETLKITGWNESLLKDLSLNLERSLKFGDRIHGHLVTGHVDGTGKVVEFSRVGDFTELTVEIPESLKSYFWKKGSVCVNGVSLTINRLEAGTLTVGLIPETLRVTNLDRLEKNQRVNLEVDFMARGLIHYFEERFPDETAFR